MRLFKKKKSEPVQVVSTTPTVHVESKPTQSSVGEIFSDLPMGSMKKNNNPAEELDFDYIRDHGVAKKSTVLDYNKWLDKSQNDIAKSMIQDEDTLLDNIRKDSNFGEMVGGINNPVVGQGMASDISAYDSRTEPGYQNQQNWTTLYRTSPIAKRIITLLSESFIGNGIDIICEETKNKKKIEKYIKDKSINKLLLRAVRQMILHGGCALLIPIADGEDQSSLLIPEEDINKETFEGFKLVDKSMLFPSNFYDQSAGSLFFNQPRQWTITAPGAVDGQGLKSNYQIDSSRFIFFIPEELPFYARINALWWADSILTPVKRLIDITDRAFQSTGNLLNQAVLKFLKIDIESYAGSPEQITKRASGFTDTVNTSKLNQNANMNIMDKNDSIEKLEVSNLKEQAFVLRTLLNQCISPFGIPLIRYWGNSPEGFGSGDSEAIQWFEEVKIKRETWIREPVKATLNIICYYLDIDPDTVDFKFNEFNRKTEEEEANTSLKNSQTAAIYKSLGLPLEVIAEELYDKGEFNSIDKEDLLKIAKTAQVKLDKLEKESMNPTSNIDPEDLADNKSTNKKPSKSSPGSVTKKAMQRKKL